MSFNPVLHPQARLQAQQKDDLGDGIGSKRRRAGKPDPLTAMTEFKKRLKTSTEDSTDTSQSASTAKGTPSQEPEPQKQEEQKGENKELNPDLEGTFAAVWKEGDEESTSDWHATHGLKFHTTADRAYAMDALRAKETLETFDPHGSAGNRELVAEKAKRQSELLMERRRTQDKTAAKSKPK